MDLKKLMEQRADLQAELDGILNKAKAEERAMTDEEVKQFDAAEAKMKSIDATIQREERARALDIKPGKQAKDKEEVEERAVTEEKAFANYIRGVVSEQRADVNLTTGDNGAVIPSSIANKIIKRYMTYAQYISFQPAIMLAAHCLFHIMMNQLRLSQWLMRLNLLSLNQQTENLQALS